MIDSHCHLNFDNLAIDIENLIRKAKNNNITSILSINTDPDEFDNHYKLIKKFKSIFLSYGLHPQQVTESNIINSAKIINKSSNDRVIAIGETGLDFFHSVKYKKKQYEVFESHIEASFETDLPLIIHQRNSENEIIDVLSNFQKSKSLKVVFHCFTGSSKLRNFCLENGFYLSLSGIITFKNAEELRTVIKNVPLSSVLIETDSPFLTPTPHRGKINEPSFVKHVAEYLSIFFKVPFEEFISITDNNFYKLFSKAIRYNEISI